MIDQLKQTSDKVVPLPSYKWECGSELESAFIELSSEGDIEDFIYRLNAIIKAKIKET